MQCVPGVPWTKVNNVAAQPADDIVTLFGRFGMAKISHLQPLIGHQLISVWSSN